MMIVLFALLCFVVLPFRLELATLRASATASRGVLAFIIRLRSSSSSSSSSGSRGRDGGKSAVSRGGGGGSTGLGLCGEHLGEGRADGLSSRFKIGIGVLNSDVEAERSGGRSLLGGDEAGDDGDDTVVGAKDLSGGLEDLFGRASIGRGVGQTDMNDGGASSVSDGDTRDGGNSSTESSSLLTDRAADVGVSINQSNGDGTGLGSVRWRSSGEAISSTRETLVVDDLLRANAKTTNRAESSIESDANDVHILGLEAVVFRGAATSSTQHAYTEAVIHDHAVLVLASEGKDLGQGSNVARVLVDTFDDDELAVELGALEVLLSKRAEETLEVIRVIVLEVHNVRTRELVAHLDGIVNTSIADEEIARLGKGRDD